MKESKRVIIDRHIRKGITFVKACALIVDDQSEMRFLIGANLKRHFGFQIVEASGLPEAVERLSECNLKLIVSDLMMPGGSGFDLLDYVELHPEIDCHFILFTSAANRMSEQDRKRTIVIDKCRLDELIEMVQFLGVANEA